MAALSLSDIAIRTDLRPGDRGYLIRLHATLYAGEYGFGPQFERYVAESMLEYWGQYDPDRNRAWICEHEGRIVGSIFLMDRGEAAQLRYFVLLPGYRGIGLGKKLMDLWMDFYRRCGYKSAFLLTTSELEAAAALYRRHGFVLVSESRHSDFGKPVIEQRYELAPRSS
jgi:GNAT superfamily N-acetyltransferase